MSRKLTRKERLQARKKAFRIWALGQEDGMNLDFDRLSRETGLTVEELEYFKVKDDWHGKLELAREKGLLEKEVKRELKGIIYEPDRKEEIDKLQQILDESGLNDRHKLFMLYFLQSYNARWAAIKVGYPQVSASVRGANVLKNPKVVETMDKIKALMHENIYIKAHDVIEEYIKIAFADITDYVTFEGNKVELKPSTQVDGTIITEIRQGRDGITLKMADKMKALERLEKILDVLPDKRLELDREKFELTKELSRKAEDGEAKVTIINDIG